MTYVDGFVLPLPKDKIEDYKKIAESAGKVWLDHGALEYRECVLQDAECHDMTPFPKLAGTTDGETVVFAYITYKSREHRDEVNKKVMADERIKCDPENMPFDHRRMAYGGFEVIVDYS